MSGSSEGPRRAEDREKIVLSYDLGRTTRNRKTRDTTTLLRKLWRGGITLVVVTNDVNVGTTVVVKVVSTG